MYSDDTPELAHSEGGAAPVATAPAKPKRIRNGKAKKIPAEYCGAPTNPSEFAALETKPKRVRKSKPKQAKAPKPKAKAKKPAKVKAPAKAKAKSKPKAEKKPAATAPTQGKDMFAIRAGSEYVRKWSANAEGVFATFTDKPAHASLFVDIADARRVLTGCKILGSVTMSVGRVVRFVSVDGVPRLPKRGRPLKIKPA